MNDVRELGVRISSNINVFDGTFYLDKVAFSDQPDVVFAFANHSGVSINLTGLKPGAYNAVVWDTTGGRS